MAIKDKDGLIGRAGIEAAGPGAVVTTAVGVQSQLVKIGTTGSITNFYGFQARTPTGTGITPTNWYDFYGSKRQYAVYLCKSARKE